MNRDIVDLAQLIVDWRNDTLAQAARFGAFRRGRIIDDQLIMVDGHVMHYTPGVSVAIYAGAYVTIVLDQSQTHAVVVGI